MNKINKTDLSTIAFCAKSAAANYSHYFDNKAVIYRKLINSFCDGIEKDCFIAIDTSQQPEQGDLTLLEFGTDSERLCVFNGENDTFGKMIAYSAANDLSKFFTLQTITTDEPQTINEDPANPKQPPTPPTHLTEITPNDINRFSEALNALLNSGLLKPDLCNDLYQLRSSLDTFESLLSVQDESQSNKGARQ